MKTMISKEYAAKQRQRVNRQQAATEFKSGIPETGDTVYLTVADQVGSDSRKDGLAIGY